MAQRTTNNPPFGWKFNGDVVDDITELYGNLPTYKKYVALITQSGTNAPTAIVLNNTFDGDILFTRFAVGTYTGKLDGIFPDENKVWMQIQNTYGTSPGVPYIYYSDVNNFSIETYVGGALSDDELYNTSIEIRVYD